MKEKTKIPLTMCALLLMTTIMAGCIDTNIQNWQRSSANPVVMGNGDTILHVNDPCVIFDNGEYQMWFGFVGSDVTYASIGYTESDDGKSWSPVSIVFTPNIGDAWDDQTTEIPSVLKDETETNPQKVYKMWYGGSNATNPTLTKIGYAYSHDGISWTRLPADESPYGKEGLVMVSENSGPGDYAVVAEPSVILKDGMFHMWYSSWGENALVISYATSADGINWAKHPSNPVLRHTPFSWESGGLGLDGTVAQPTVLWDSDNSSYMMWYGSFNNAGTLTYTGIGFASSKDGVNWTKLDKPALRPNYSKGEELGIGTGPFVLLKDNIYHMWYGSVDSSFNRVISYATMNPSELLVRYLKDRMDLLQKQKT